MWSQPELFQKINETFVFLVYSNLSSKREEQHSPMWMAQLGLESAGVRHWTAGESYSPAVF